MTIHSSGVHVHAFTVDGYSDSYETWGSLFFQIGPATHASDGGGTVTLEFEAAGVWYPFLSISYTVAAEALLTLPRGVRLALRWRLNGSTNPDLYIITMTAPKP